MGLWLSMGRRTHELIRERLHLCSTSDMAFWERTSDRRRERDSLMRLYSTLSRPAFAPQLVHSLAFFSGSSSARVSLRHLYTVEKIHLLPLPIAASSWAVEN